MRTIGIVLVVIVVGIGGYFLWQSSVGTNSSELATTTGTQLTQLRDPDSQTPAAGTCVFQESDMVNFDINSDIPSPRCIFALQNQKLGFTNKTTAEVQFSFAGASFSIAPEETERIEEAIGSYLAPGVHRVAMPNYNGSGPEVWVLDQTVGRIEGTVKEVFASAKGMVVETSGGVTLNLGLTDETQIVKATSTPVAVKDFSTAIKPNTKISAIIDLENETTGNALTIRILP